MPSDPRGKADRAVLCANGSTPRMPAVTQIFHIVIDWVMRKATKDRRMGIQWTLTKHLKKTWTLRADDISLLAHRHEDTQTKLEHVADEAEKVGLQININKTEVMQVNNKRQEAIQLQGRKLKKLTASPT